MTRYALMILVMCIGNTVAFAAERENACVTAEPTLNHLSAPEMRALAARCESLALSRLFYNRAYHLELLERAEKLAGLRRQDGSPVNNRHLAHRMYMVLVESFAPAWFPDQTQRVAFLNREYERRSEVMELRLEGYDRLADIKERTTFSDETLMR